MGMTWPRIGHDNIKPKVLTIATFPEVIQLPALCVVHDPKCPKPKPTQNPCDMPLFSTSEISLIPGSNGIYGVAGPVDPDKMCKDQYAKFGNDAWAANFTRDIKDHFPNDPNGAWPTKLRRAMGSAFYWTDTPGVAVKVAFGVSMESQVATNCQARMQACL